MRSLLLLLFIFVMASSAIAIPVDNYLLEFNVVDDTVVVMTEMEFDQKITDVLRVPIPKDSRGVDLYIDGDGQDIRIDKNNLLIRLNGNRKVKYSYASSQFLDRSNFVYNFKASDEIKLLEVRLILPEGVILKDEVSKSVFPAPDVLITDGRSLLLAWKRQNLNPGDELSVFTRYQLREEAGLTIVLAIIAVLIAFGILYYAVISKKKKPEKVEKKSKSRKIVKEEYDILKHFKEEEQQIIRVLKQRDGSCEQGTLRVITGFSKATLSRLLSELEARKVIHKEKRGKKNLVFLKEY